MKRLFLPHANQIFDLLSNRERESFNLKNLNPALYNEVIKSIGQAVVCAEVAAPVLESLPKFFVMPPHPTSLLTRSKRLGRPTTAVTNEKIPELAEKLSRLMAENPNIRQKDLAASLGLSLRTYERYRGHLYEFLKTSRNEEAAKCRK